MWLPPLLPSSKPQHFQQPPLQPIVGPQKAFEQSCLIYPKTSLQLSCWHWRIFHGVVVAAAVEFVVDADGTVAGHCAVAVKVIVVGLPLLPTLGSTTYQAHDVDDDGPVVLRRMNWRMMTCQFGIPPLNYCWHLRRRCRLLHCSTLKMWKSSLVSAADCASLFGADVRF